MTDLAVKFAEGSKDTIEGLAIPYSVDFDGETFGPDTDLCLEWFGPSGRPLLYQHGFDKTMKTSIIGRQIEYEEREEGLWARAQLDMAAKYRKTIDRLIAEGALGFSSGAIDHLSTKTASGHITRWPWMELSLTTTPAHPGTSVYTVKSSDAIAHMEASDIEVTDLVKAAIKALDEAAELRDAPPGSEALSARLDRVSGEVRGLVDHLGEHVEMKVKSGRSVSRATWQQVQAMAEVHRQGLALLEEFLASHDPDAGKALDAAMFEALATEARLLGVPV